MGSVFIKKDFGILIRGIIEKTTKPPGEERSIVSLEDLELSFNELCPYLLERLEVEPHEAEPAPEFLRREEAVRRGEDSGFSSFAPLLYSKKLNAVVINEQRIEESTGDIRSAEVGEEVAHWLREVVGPGDEIPRYLPVSEFFGRIGRRLIAEVYDRQLEPPTVHKMVGTPLPRSEREIREELIEKSSKESKEGNLLSALYWSSVAHYAGQTAADENMEEVLKDPDLLYRDSMEIREKYGIDRRELEGIRNIFV